jgi:hypothetical protein
LSFDAKLCPKITIGKIAVESRPNNFAIIRLAFFKGPPAMSAGFSANKSGHSPTHGSPARSGRAYSPHAPESPSTGNLNVHKKFISTCLAADTSSSLLDFAMISTSA